MDWKEQLSTVVREGEIEFLDIRFICVKQQEQWFLRRFRATAFHANPSVPELVRYSSYLFLRQKMSATDFLQLLSDLTAEKKLLQQAQEQSPRELQTQKAEEKRRTFSVGDQELCFDSVGISFSDHARGNTLWGLVDRPLPTWNFGGIIWPEVPENQEPLVASDAPYFPTPLDGQAWYLYEKAFQSPNNFLPSVEIVLEDSRAFFREVTIDEKAATVVCQCGGTLLAKARLRLYTNASQIEEKQASSEITFRLQDEPKVISLALTYHDIWLDRQDTNLDYLPLGIPRGIKLTGRSLRSANEGTGTSTPAIEAIVRSDSSDLAAVAGPHLILADRFYNNVLDQSRQSFKWAMGGFVGVFVLVAAAILLLLVRPLGDASNLAAIITALGGVPSSLLAAYLLNLHKRASDQAAASQVNLDRIQRFFIAITVSSHVKEEIRDETRVALIKKLNDL